MLTPPIKPNTALRPRAPPSGARRKRRRSFAILFAALFILSAGNSAFSVVLPSIGRELGLRDALIAGVAAVSAFIFTLSAPFWARVSDRVGRKPIIQLSLASYALAMASIGVVVLFGLHGLLGASVTLAGMMVSRAIFGLFGSAAQPAAQAYVAQSTEVDERTRALSTLASAFSLGIVLGPLAGLVLALEPIGLTGPIFTFSVIAALMLPVIALGLEEPAVKSPVCAGGPRLRPWRDRRFRPFLVYAFLITSVQAVNAASIGFLVIDDMRLAPARAPAFVGLVLVAGAIAALVAQWVLIPALKPGPGALLRWGATFVCCGNGLLAFAHGFAAIIGCFVLINIGFGLARPGFGAGASIAARDDEQGAVAGSLAGAFGAAFIASPVLGVGLYEAWAPAPFLLNTAVSLGLLIFASRNGALSAEPTAARTTTGGYK